MHNEKHIILIVHSKCACTGLTFNTLPEETRKKIEIKTYAEFNQDIKNNFLRAKAIIFSREMNLNTLLLTQACISLKIPYYYYVDDNLFELGIVPKTADTLNTIRHAKACILTSDALIEYFKENNLHDKFYSVIPAISDEQKQELEINLDKYDNPKQINFLYASNNRFDGLLKMSEVFIKLTKEYSVKFFIFKRMEPANQILEFEKICSENNIEIEYLDAFEDHRLFIKKIASLNIHFIIHPQGFTNYLFTLNHKYKTLNFLLNAYLASSLIFVPNVEPYSKLKQAGMISNIVYDDNDEVYAKIKEILSNKDFAKDLFNALEKYCLTNFDPKINEKVILEIFETLSVSVY